MIIVSAVAVGKEVVLRSQQKSVIFSSFNSISSSLIVVVLTVTSSLEGGGTTGFVVELKNFCMSNVLYKHSDPQKLDGCDTPLVFVEDTSTGVCGSIVVVDGDGIALLSAVLVATTLGLVR